MAVALSETIVLPGGARRELRARTTDLPAEILAAPEGTAIEAASIRIAIARDGLSWECRDAEVEADFARALNG